MTPETIAQDELDAPTLVVFGESEVTGTFVDLTVDKALSVHGPVPPSAEL